MNESYTVELSHNVINNLHISDFPHRNVPQRVNNEIGKFPVEKNFEFLTKSHGMTTQDHLNEISADALLNVFFFS